MVTLADLYHLAYHFEETTDPDHLMALHGQIREALEIYIDQQASPEGCQTTWLYVTDYVWREMTAFIRTGDVYSLETAHQTLWMGLAKLP